MFGIIHDFSLVAMNGSINKPFGVFGDEMCVYSV